MKTHPFRRAGAIATVFGLVLAVLLGSHHATPIAQTQRVQSEPLIAEYQLGNMQFSGFYTVVTTSDIEVHFHESGRTFDQLWGTLNKSNCNDQRCPPTASQFHLGMFDPTGKSLGQAWGTVAYASTGPIQTSELPEVDFDMTWPRGVAGRYRLVVGYLGLGTFERYVDVR